MELWKLFTTADAITFIKAAMDESKPETVNACWKVMWNEVVKNFKGFLKTDGEVKKIIRQQENSGKI
jgi:hypothetical protein